MADYGLVSIIVPMYNTGIYIIDTINSILSQTYTNFEILVIDDCSTDNSVEIVRSINDNRIILLSNEKNSGAAESRNNGLRNATGKWIAFLDSDDLWLPNKLEKQLEFMINNDYNFTFTEYIEIDEHNNPTGVKLTGPKIVNKRRMYNFCYMGCLTVMYNRELIGLIQVDQRIKKRNDYAIWLQVIKKTNAYLLPAVLSCYRRRSGSISNVSIWKLIKAHYILFNISEGFGRIHSLSNVMRNVFFGFLKKVKYKKKYISK